VNLLTGVATGQGSDTLHGFTEIIRSDFGDISAEVAGGTEWRSRPWRNDKIYGSDGTTDSGAFLASGPDNGNLFGLGGFDELRGNLGDDLLDGGANGEFGDVVQYGDVLDAGRSYPGAQAGIKADLVGGAVFRSCSFVSTGRERPTGSGFDSGSLARYLRIGKFPRVSVPF
jgi:hypothetical protein